MPCRLSMMKTGNAENSPASVGSNQPITSRVARNGAASSGSSDLVQAPAATIAAPASTAPRSVTIRTEPARGSIACTRSPLRMSAPAAVASEMFAAIDASTSTNPPSG